MAKMQPSEAQKKAGNYKKQHIKLQGLDISIENPAGSVRSGTSSDGKQWRTKMNHHYGYIRKTLGPDGDHVDVFIKPGTKTLSMIYIVNQVDPKTRKFDEHKCMLGFDSLEDAKKAYLSNYEKGWTGIGDIKELALPHFKDWVYNKVKTKKMVKSDTYNFSDKSLISLISSINRNGFI